MLEASILIGVGLILLNFSADKFVDAAVDLSICLRIPTLVVGLVVVGFATSAPELIVSITAAFSGHPSLSIGNALGSNIANIGLVLGMTSIIVPLYLSQATFEIEFRLMLVALVIFTLVVSDLSIARIDGIILGLSLLIILFLMVKFSSQNSLEIEGSIDGGSPGLGKSSFWLLIGFAIMLLGSDILVRGSISLAKLFGASDLFIGLTIVAVGTSLPELAASIAAALKKKADIVIGNIIGSNTFNALAVTAMPALVEPFTVEVVALSRDVAIMWLLTIILIVILFIGKNKLTICKFGGCILLACFCFYQFFLFQMQNIT